MESRNPFVNQVFGFNAMISLETSKLTDESQSLRESGLWFRLGWQPAICRRQVQVAIPS